jgi:hypothetical protein
MTSWRVVVGAAMLAGTFGQACADIGLQAGVEQFRWREYDDGGTRLLEESGPRYHFGAVWRKPLDAGRQLLQVRGSVYGGSVDYDGQACNSFNVCTPFQSTTDYSGLEADATFAWRFGGPEVFAGGGFDTWRRRIKGHGNVRGVTEDWTVFNALAGVGAQWGSRFHVRGGVKYPFYTHEQPDTFNVTLRPKGRASLFANFSWDAMSGGRPRWGIGAYYDAYRFAESDKERDGSFIVWQPKSSQDVFGVYGTYYLR